MKRTTTIELFKESMKFSAGHFTVFSATERERLHGHNFTVRVQVTGYVGDNGLAFDYGIYKHELIRLCRSYNEIFMLPTRCPHLRIEERGEQVIAHFNGEEIPFLKKDVMLLPLRNISVEELSELLLGQVLEYKDGRRDDDIQRIVVHVFTGPGQGASATWQRQ